MSKPSRITLLRTDSPTPKPISLSPSQQKPTSTSQSRLLGTPSTNANKQTILTTLSSLPNASKNALSEDTLVHISTASIASTKAIVDPPSESVTRMDVHKVTISTPVSLCLNVHPAEIPSQIARNARMTQTLIQNARSAFHNTL